ncbi:MAG: ABC transporter substrate-binding protein [Deltaproteobacteria bacterium]|nr:ABC transporter substrate-binding protein [Deltaproteobacteria bacterium]
MRRLVLAGLIIAVSWSARAEAQPRPAVLHVGTVGVLVDAPFYIGHERGYFREEGLEVRLTHFASAARIMTPMAAGELQVAGGGVNVGTFNGVARGWPIVMVTSRSTLVPGHDGNVFMVRQDLKDRVKSPRDLRGKRFAINAVGSPLVFMLGRALETEGLVLKDLEILTLSFPHMAGAFQQKAIDAAIVVEPFVSVVEEQGLAVSWKTVADFVRNPYMDVSVLFYNRDWAAGAGETPCRFMVAWMRGVRDYLKAITPGPAREEVVKVLVRHAQVRDPKLYDKMRWNFIHPNGYINLRSVEDQQEWYIRKGFLKQRVPLDKLVDHRYLECALGRIGRVEVRVP